MQNKPGIVCKAPKTEPQVTCVSGDLNEAEKLCALERGFNSLQNAPCKTVDGRARYKCIDEAYDCVRADEWGTAARNGTQRFGTLTQKPCISGGKTGQLCKLPE